MSLLRVSDRVPKATRQSANFKGQSYSSKFKMNQKNFTFDVTFELCISILPFTLCIFNFFLGGFHHVPNAAYRMNELLSGFAVDLVSKVIDINVDNIRAGVEIVVPDVL